MVIKFQQPKLIDDGTTPELVRIERVNWTVLGSPPADADPPKMKGSEPAQQSNYSRVP